VLESVKVRGVDLGNVIEEEEGEEMMARLT